MFVCVSYRIFLLFPQQDLIEIGMYTKMACCHMPLKYLAQASVLDTNSEENAIKVCNPIMYQKKILGWPIISSNLEGTKFVQKNCLWEINFNPRENINILKCVLLAA